MPQLSTEQRVFIVLTALMHAGIQTRISTIAFLRHLINNMPQLTLDLANLRLSCNYKTLHEF